MALISWKDSLNVGHPDLDADHRRLVALINDFFETWRTDPAGSEAALVLDQLVDYTDSHFLREETLLAERGYGRLAEQRLAHLELRVEVQLIRQKIAENDPRLTPRTIGRVLQSWLLDHIVGEDRLYRELFAGEGDAPKAGCSSRDGGR